MTKYSEEKTTRLSITIGTTFYSMHSDNYIHVLWHLFVVAGTAFIYTYILQCV